MKTNKIFKFNITLVCFVFILGIAGNMTCLWATTDTGELGMEEESQDVRSHTGRLDYIDQDRVVINDFPLHTKKDTQYRTTEGNITTSDHFTEGDTVSFLTDRKETVLIELQMRGTDMKEQQKTLRIIEGGGSLQLKDGVWTN